MTTETPYDTPPSRRRPTLLKALIFIVLMAAITAGLLAAASLLRSKEGPKIATVEPQPLAVSVSPVEYLTELDIEELFTGIAEARRTSRLGFQTGGRIERIDVRVGDTVKAGQTIARLDTRGLGAQLASARAVVEEARAAHQLALDTAERQRQLQAQGHVSAQRVEEFVAQATTAMARVEAARAQADTLRVQIDLASITAPYDGVIVSRFADEGAIAGPGQAILELVEAGDLEARIGVSARIVPELVPGETYTLEAETGPVEAPLRSVTGVVDASQRTVAAVFDVPASSGVPAGSLVRLKMQRKLQEKGFWVPLKALSSANRGMWTVYAVVGEDDDWRAQPRLVEMVYPAGERAFVRGPVEAGDRIIVDGLQRVTPGARVLPREVQRAEAANGG
ncbi:efflux transporter periplasmic adaptor subunit [Hyphomonas sp. CACIAM 19H1]|uniref:efflux RND transporter periplasmic adaptor subunit n=1 Tax=Hyphomonas sp. CACIAM 19H1 TaxID=1873716 RepID=UPI000DEE1549|nr:efflux RND transporter periplasmic adaptor subunit [Hyphomonas sp. CACIAM 19H1]AXE64283.1 efflux transporter periplasmic adaptor subunit [Hyphomonas sp. CACIAM 19H1]